MVSLDLAVYLQHILHHAVPVLWRLHRVHHADLDFDLTTGLRFHPIEIVISMGIKLSTVAAIGAPPLAVLIFEKMNTTTAVKSILYFVLAGLFEIGGGYLMWLWLREGKPLRYGLTGACVLVLYGIVPTLQPAHFGRVYAAYGGVFIVMSILWGWKVDKIAPDTFDVIGGLVALIGVGIIMYWPRPQ